MATLAADLFLLATDADSGRPLIDTTHLDFGLSGALLLELALQQRITLRDWQIEVTDAGPTGDPLLDAALSDIAAAKPHEPGHWVRQLSHGVRHAVADRLVAAGVLCRDRHKVLGIIPVQRTHETDGRLHHQLRDQLHDAVVLGADATEETAALAALVLAVGLAPHLFPRSDRRAVQHRVAEIAGQCPECWWVADAVHRAVDATDVVLGLAPEAGRSQL